jgi:chromosome segregation ATPase
VVRGQGVVLAGIFGSVLSSRQVEFKRRTTYSTNYPSTSIHTPYYTPIMSREDLKKQIRALDHELELSTLINKGAIQEGRELKARVAELELENKAFRNTERRLTQTEERLEESEDAIKEKEAQITRLKDAVNDLKGSLRNALKERDEWSNRWGRAADFFAKEEEDIADTAMDRATDAFTTVS